MAADLIGHRNTTDENTTKYRTGKTPIPQCLTHTRTYKPANSQHRACAVSGFRNAMVGVITTSNFTNSMSSDGMDKLVTTLASVSSQPNEVKHA